MEDKRCSNMAVSGGLQEQRCCQRSERITMKPGHSPWKAAIPRARLPDRSAHKPSMEHCLFAKANTTLEDSWSFSALCYEALR